MNQKKEVRTEKNPSLSQEIKRIIENITKEYGEGTITTLGESKLKDQKTLSTGSLLLDQTIGTGGYVCGKIVEIYGLESSGKSTLALHAVSECQKLKKKAVYIDLENGLNIKYAQNIGVDKENLMILYPNSAVKTFEMIRDLIREGTDLIVVDSVSNLAPQMIDLEKYKIGSHALLMSQGLRMLKNELTNKDTIIIFINQVRNKISTGHYGGNPETTTGGMALRFDSDIRIKLKTTGKIEKNSKVVGIEVEALIKKSKPQNQDKYQLLIVGKKQLPSTEKEKYFLFLEAIKTSKKELLSSLNEKHYSTKTRGERTLPVSHCLGVGKYLLVAHNNHSHFIYQLTNPPQIKETQKEFNLQKEGDYLISIKNPQAATSSGVGLPEKQKVKFPPSLQNKFDNYSFIPLTTSEFLDYEGVELLLIAKGKEDLTTHESELESCLKKIHPDNLLEEFAKIGPPDALSPIKE
ncbi:6981_t:CDS:2 [Paraglomus occultum]|uniref:6981_t:CDS:1 n=1 Tax=Paraglomus occultum TaxID=144539 RepID=A0A9N8W7Y8_9GLOM|nr:6981_t:CDS:2 [Paraglomus occultum]